MSNLNPNVKERMLDYLPYYYHESKIVANIIEAQSKEVEQLNVDLTDLLDQFFVETATWGLVRWESICDIKTDLSLDIDVRRSRIKAKLRGQGTSTKKMIQTTAESFKHGEVEVTEHFNDYSITVKFVSKKGVPTHLPSIKQALFEIIPAHLNIFFEFTWLTWDEFEEKMLTWDEFEARERKWDEIEIWNRGERR